MKGTGAATDWQEIDRWDGGVGWLAYPGEEMQRASHAFVADGDVWLVDPVDAEGIDDVLAEFGDVAGVVVLLDRHLRDADVFAQRHGVSVYVPDWMTGVEDDIDAPVERVHRDLEDTGFAFHTLVDNRFWQEAILYGEDSNTLYVPEALGTVDYFLAPGERIGVHPALRLKPPRKLGRLSPERLFVGHGAGIPTDATDAIQDALDGARRRTPMLYAKTVKGFVLG